jgi:hypothetical protein
MNFKIGDVVKPIDESIEGKVLGIEKSKILVLLNDGFEEYYFADCDAPAVREAVVKIAMKLEEKIPIRLNGTIMIIGSIQQIEIQDGLICEDGFVSLSDAQVLISQGLDAYFDSKFIGREPYAKPQI